MGGVCQHHNVNTAGKEEGAWLKKEEEDEKHKTFNQVQVWFLDKAGLFSFCSIYSFYDFLSWIHAKVKGQHLELHMEIHMLILLVICASIKICRYNEAVSYGYVRTRGKGGGAWAGKEIQHLFHVKKKER